MCDLIDKYEKRGMRQGIRCGAESAILIAIKNLMKNLETVEQAMAALEILKYERQNICS